LGGDSMGIRDWKVPRTRRLESLRRYEGEAGIQPVEASQMEFFEGGN
jgi:hypothetical protein